MIKKRKITNWDTGGPNMFINFNEMIERTVPGMNEGTEELLTAGTCHICKKGSEHSIVNTGNEDLVLLTVVVER